MTSPLQPYWDGLISGWDDVWSSYSPALGLADDSKERILFTVGCALATGGTFYFLNALLYFVYHFDLFSSYKISPGVWPDRSLVIKSLCGEILDHTIARPIVFYVLYPSFKRFGMPAATAPMPGAAAILLQFVICVAANDTLFYWIHRLLHHRYIYKHIHKQHHEYKASIGISAEYVHPIEGLISSGFPTLAGCWFTGAHIGVLWMWLIFRVIETVDSHCGYNFPFSPFRIFPSIQGGATHHDFHHSHNVGCFGAMTVFWDWLCGTDKAYKAWMAKQQQAAKKPKSS